MGTKFGTEEGTKDGGGDPLVPSSVPNFAPIGVTCCPWGQKKHKIGLAVKKITAKSVYERILTFGKVGDKSVVVPFYLDMV